MASISQAPVRFGRLRGAASSTLGFIGNLGLFFGIALIGGIGSSWYMIEIGTRLTTVTVGPWVSWPAAATPDADPYTRARAARHGSLPISGNVARTFEARTDSTGQRLHSSCDYAVATQGLDDGWWTMAVYDDNGHLIANPADRHAFNSSTVARSADGSFVVSLGRDARPGNWLPTGGAGRLTLVLTLLESGDGIAQGGAAGLPDIRRVACR
ncbi:MAG: DUF1214 domain-containing protein [Hyphomicrobiaceae bacterium]|nr:DUF1214 domain-containing protein [Hyphomicrobiaceae bacterium]